MNKISIKLRVTIGYTLLVMLVCGVLVGAIIAFNEPITEKSIYELLESEVEQKVEQLSHAPELTIAVSTSYVSNGVYLQIYDKNGDMIAGELPDGFASTLTPIGDCLITTRNEHEGYMCHCRYTSDKSYIVRGVMSRKNMKILVKTVIMITLYAIPLLVLMAFGGGIMIAHLAFRPLDNINKTIEEIAGGNDLSKRIDNRNIPKGEIDTLGRNFNIMMERLEEAFESEKQFISDASHELRTPVSVILAQCQWAKIKSKSEEERQTFEVIERQAKRMSLMISRLLMLTRMDRGIEKTDKSPLDVSELLRGVCSGISDVYPDVDFSADIEPELYASINIECLSSAYENLITNAIRYGGGKVRALLKGESGEIVFEITDNGIGILDEDKDKIWNRFYRGKNVPTHEGMGLGLAFVREAAQLHGGRAELVSGESGATTFRFVLPEYME